MGTLFSPLLISKYLIILSITLLVLLELDTSHLCAKASKPFFFISSTVSLVESKFKSKIWTEAPWLDRVLAIAFPIPLPPPVTIEVLFF